jgi:hypothetical protein
MNDLLFFAIAFTAFFQIIVLICFFMIGSNVEKLVKTAKFVQEQQLPALSAQLQQIHERLAELSSRP